MKKYSLIYCSILVSFILLYACEKDDYPTKDFPSYCKEKHLGVLNLADSTRELPIFQTEQIITYRDTLRNTMEMRLKIDDKPLFNVDSRTYFARCPEDSLIFQVYKSKNEVKYLQLEAVNYNPGINFKMHLSLSLRFEADTFYIMDFVQVFSETTKGKPEYSGGSYLVNRRKAPEYFESSFIPKVSSLQIGDTTLYDVMGWEYTNFLFSLEDGIVSFRDMDGKLWLKK